MGRPGRVRDRRPPGRTVPATEDEFVPRVPRRHRVLRVLGVGISFSLDQRSRRRQSVDSTTLADAPSSRARAGTPTAPFDDFYRSNYAPVVRLAYSLCGSMQIAEELAQDAFVSAHRRWSRIRAFDRPDLWVRRVVINRSISYRRRQVSERRAIAKVRARRVVAASDPVVSDEAVWQALRELSPRQAEVLALFYVEDRPLSDVAAILGLGTETVKTHLKRGRLALAERLGERREDIA